MGQLGFMQPASKSQVNGLGRMLTNSTGMLDGDGKDALG